MYCRVNHGFRLKIGKINNITVYGYKFDHLGSEQCYIVGGWMFYREKLACATASTTDLVTSVTIKAFV